MYIISIKYDEDIRKELKEDQERKNFMNELMFPKINKDTYFQRFRKRLVYLGSCWPTP